MPALNDVSIVIPTHDRLPLLREAIRSASLQSVDPQIIVVRSNGESAAENLGLEFPGIMVIECSGERAASRNAGCDRATGDWVLFLDDDDLLLPGALEVLLSAARPHNADAARGTRIDFADGHATPDAQGDEPAFEHFLASDDLVIGAEIQIGRAHV